MGRPPIKTKPMTPAQRQKRYRRAVALRAKQASTRAKQDRRRARLAAGTLPPTDTAIWRFGDPERFNVLYVDPPWQFAVYARESGLMRAADLHYETMETAAIMALEVPSAADCVLFLWATVPMLLDALAVMAAWGFTYKSQYAWGKRSIKMGHWARSRHELLLIGTRGKIAAPAPGEQFESLILPWLEIDDGGRPTILAGPFEHSEKPDVFAEMIEAMFPGVARLEMFARKHRAGWTAHGVELPGG
jgi:N6-adenosine-specific RNA methylase IME4